MRILMIGINDVSHNLSTDSITTLLRNIVEKIRTDSPQTKLYLQSLLPINESFGRYSHLKGKTSQIPEINAHLRQLAKTEKIPFIDLFSKFCEKNSQILRADLSTDGLHLQEAGYKIWEKALGRNI